MAIEYLSEEARARAKAALAFHASEARKAYSAQRIPNTDDDLIASLREGIEELKTHGKALMAVLTTDAKND